MNEGQVEVTRFSEKLGGISKYDDSYLQ